MVTNLINGLSSRRRHRDEDIGVELHESIRLKDRVKKDRDRERDRNKLSSRSKRRRNYERLLMHSDGVNSLDDDTSGESVNDDEEDDDYIDDNCGGERFPPPNPVVPSNYLHHRKTAPVWKSGDDMIGVPIPRKARSASNKRPRGGSEQNHQQASPSPVKQSPMPAGTPAHPMSPSSVRKKLKSSNGLKPRPPKSTVESTLSNPEELEIEIAEVLSNLMTQSQAKSKKEISAVDAKSRVSSPISSSSITHPSSILRQNPISITVPKKKRTRQVIDNMGSSSVRNIPTLKNGSYDSKMPPKQPEEPHVVEKSAESQPLKVVEIDLRAGNEDQKPTIIKTDVIMVAKGDGDKVNKATSAFKKSEYNKPVEIKKNNIHVELNLENPKREDVKANKEDPNTEKMAQSNWARPGGLPPIEHIESRTKNIKRCATHWYIARNIDFLQQFTKLNPYETVVASLAGSSSLVGSKSSNLNGSVPLPSINIGVINVDDKGQNGLSIFPSHGSADKATQPPYTAAQKQQQSIMNGPAFIFPIHQQVAMASARPGSVKPSTTTTGGASTESSSVVNGVAATTMSFSYPNETAFLQNNGYPLRIPGVEGVAPPNYGGSHLKAMPLFNGSLYTPQLSHYAQPPPQGQNRTSQQPQPLQVRHVEAGHNYGMSYGPTRNGAATSFDLSSMAQNQATFHNFQEVNLKKMHMMAQAQAQKNKRIFETGGDESSSITSSLARKANESSASHSTSSSSGGNGGVHNAQLKLQQFQRQQIMQFHSQQIHQQQLSATSASSRSKTLATINRNILQDASLSSSVTANSISAVQQFKTSGPGYRNKLEEAYSHMVAKYPQPPPHAKNSARTTTTSQAPASTAHSHTQLSFNSNKKGGGIFHSVNQHPLVHSGYSYVPAALQVKPFEKKQPDLNDNFHSLRRNN